MGDDELLQLRGNDKHNSAQLREDREKQSTPATAACRENHRLSQNL